MYCIPWRKWEAVSDFQDKLMQTTVALGNSELNSLAMFVKYWPPSSIGVILVCLLLYWPWRALSREK